jgi:hypothetical protein
LIWQFDQKSEGDLKERLTALARASLALGLDDLIAMVYYLWGQLDERGLALLRDVLADIVPGKEKEVMQTVGEQLVAQGMAKGMAQGMAKGMAQGEAKILLRQLRRRFGNFDESIVARIQTAEIDQLDEWWDRFEDAQSLEEIFASPQKP